MWGFFISNGMLTFLSASCLFLIFSYSSLTRGNLPPGKFALFKHLVIRVLTNAHSPVTPTRIKYSIQSFHSQTLATIHFGLGFELFNHFLFYSAVFFLSLDTSSLCTIMPSILG